MSLALLLCATLSTASAFAQAAEDPAPPMRREQLGAMTRLAAGQTLLGAYLLGPHLARLSYDPQRSATPYYLGALGGAALGAGSGIWLGTRPGFDEGESGTILSSEVLGGATGIAIGYLADPHDRLGPSWGLPVGVGLGAATGILLARTDPDPTDALAIQTGALWGTGLVGAGLVFAEVDSGPDGVVVPLVAGADLGAALGWVLADRMDLGRRQLAFFDLGGVLGAGGGLLILAIASDSNDVSPQVGSVLVTGTAVTGAVLAAWLSEGEGRSRPVVAHAALWGRPGDLHLSLPMPSARPARQGHALDLQLVDWSF